MYLVRPASDPPPPPIVITPGCRCGFPGMGLLHNRSRVVLRVPGKSVEPRSRVGDSAQRSRPGTGAVSVTDVRSMGVASSLRTSLRGCALVCEVAPVDWSTVTTDASGAENGSGAQ